MAAAFRAAQAAAVTMPFSLPPAAPTSPALTSIAALQAAALQAALGAATTGLFYQIPAARALPVLGAAIPQMIFFVLSLSRTSTYLHTSTYPPRTCISTYFGGGEHSKIRQMHDG